MNSLKNKSVNKLLFFVVVILLKIFINQLTVAQILEKGIIKNNMLYIAEKATGIDYQTIAPYLLSYNLNEKAEPAYTELFVSYKTTNFNLPFCYDITEKWAYPMGGFEGSMTSPTRFAVWRTPICLFDSTTFVKNTEDFWAKILKAYPNEPQKSNAINHVVDSVSKSRQKFSIFPVMKLMSYHKEIKRNRNKLKNAVCYDFRIIDSTHFDFFVRDWEIMTRWKCTCSKDINNSQIQTIWEETITYSMDSVSLNSETPMEYLPTKHKTIINSVKDSAFFTGHFKVIYQKDEIFMINIHHGNIYWIGPQSIELVGKIDIQNYPVELLGRRFFIEDRDSNQIILFSKVERMNEDLPFLSIKVMNSKETQEKFGSFVK